jgi:uncharacterized protein YjiS (DUF1127 family)
MKMTVECHGHAAAAWRFPAMLAGILRNIRVVLQRRQALVELSELSDHHLQDVGIDRPQIAELVKREIAWNDVLDSGWSRSRRPRRH